MEHMCPFSDVLLWNPWNLWNLWNLRNRQAARAGCDLRGVVTGDLSVLVLSAEGEDGSDAKGALTCSCGFAG
jgi:hypothetical protein